ncbi:MAG: tRNA (adenosine(37)-N6)-threonylcarbamoyltransferase complex transferase subunit TsaD [Candidatus Campbellbacteria bacterium]|nr:tRNA (adenosine(37)-N6)-threonylcarbamoyltransferase complex transferase subunit TsaD [Candidatus Campbellbacteria bacterium]
MRLFAIETSCDETAVCFLDAVEKDGGDHKIEVLSHILISQAEKHAEYGGVFPTLAKREHAKNLVPITLKALEEVGVEKVGDRVMDKNDEEKIGKILEREEELKESFIEEIAKCGVPDVDAIAVCVGPGLEPTLWVGINFAEALSVLWDKPIIPVNHMEGHIVSSFFDNNTLKKFPMPLLSLLISGGHTELVLSEKQNDYRKIGSTRDDAVGESFDKVARLLGLSYPGGPEVARLASLSRTRAKKIDVRFPRPMIKDDGFDFSFSGLKTAVRYFVEGKNLTDAEKEDVACEFEDAVTEVLVTKTKMAILKHRPSALAVGGGVAANKNIKEAMTKMVAELDFPVSLHIPKPKDATDNAIMIGLSGYLNSMQKDYGMAVYEIRADSSLSYLKN